MERENKAKYAFGLLRLAMGWIFFWAFIDKLFGLGFSTLPEKSWIAGSSPTFGFLKFATKGIFAPFYQSLAGNPLVDWLFMLGLLFAGITLIFGVLLRLGGSVAILMLTFFYTAGFMPPEHNPFLDEHIIYIFVILALILVGSGRWLGFGQRWSNTKLVGKLRFLE
ncbi:MAG: hypothetical protein HYW70_03475 [Candidatus Nealsonbacteria bacterium]|nr:hypothetical protein [Candidatus Nealsonbacteria bacterium]